MTSPTLPRRATCYAEARAVAERERALVLGNLARAVTAWLRLRLGEPRGPQRKVALSGAASTPRPRFAKPADF
jgi:hypothetical protein